MTSKFTDLRVRVLDSCPELYVGIKDNLPWQPESDEQQRRGWLAPQVVVAAAGPVSRRCPRPESRNGLDHRAPASSCSTRAQHKTLMAPYTTAQTSPGRELSRLPPSSNSCVGPSPGCIGSRPESLGDPSHNLTSCRVVESSPPRSASSSLR